MFRIFLCLSIFISSSAWSNPIQLKDMQAKPGPDNTIVIQHAGETATVEILGNQRFRVNGVVLALNANDTLQTATQKLRQSYLSSKKKNALLEGLLIHEAHAVPPVWFTLLFGGMVGAGIASAVCNRSANGGATPQGSAQ